MKVLLNRYNRGHFKDKSTFAPSYQKEKLPQLPPLREWPPYPPPLEQPQRDIDSPTSFTSFKPLPELSSRPLSPIEDSLVPFDDYDPISKSYPRDSLDVARERLPQLPPLHEWPPYPPPLEQPRRYIDSPTSITLFKPLPELSSRPLPPIEDSFVPFADYDPISISYSRDSLLDVAEEDSVDKVVVTRTTSPRVDQDSARRSSRKTDNGTNTTTNGSNAVPKKVAFLFPPLTLSNPDADDPLSEDASTSNKSTAVRSQFSHPKDPRSYMSTAASGSRPDVGSSQNSTQTVEATSTRSVAPNSAKPAYGDGATIHQSLRSGTPFSQKSIGSALPPASWGEGVEEDLVTNLGPRERTRQEVLWEIVASEERYGCYPCLLNWSVNCPADMSPSCSR